MRSPAPDPSTLAPTLDHLLGGRVRLWQPARGYRVAIDPVLLAAAVPAAAGESVLDAGAGSGAASLCLATRQPASRIVGLELQPGLLRLAGQNVALNDLEGRVEMVQGDLERPPPRLAGTSFDHVMTNPPYLAAGAASASPVAERVVANLEQELDLAGWLGGCLRRLRPGGMLSDPPRRSPGRPARSLARPARRPRRLPALAAIAGRQSASSPRAERAAGAR